jgi:hypothetical protein
MRRTVKETRCELTLRGLIGRENRAADSTGLSAAVLAGESAVNLARPAGLESRRAGEREASAKEVAGKVPCTGSGARAPKNVVRSQVENGAVNGESVSTMSQPAIIFPITRSVSEAVAR